MSIALQSMSIWTSKDGFNNSITYSPPVQMDMRLLQWTFAHDELYLCFRANPDGDRIYLVGRDATFADVMYGCVWHSCGFGGYVKITVSEEIKNLPYVTTDHIDKYWIDPDPVWVATRMQDKRNPRTYVQHKYGEYSGYSPDTQFVQVSKDRITKGLSIPVRAFEFYVPGKKEWMPAVSLYGKWNRLCLVEHNGELAFHTGNRQFHIIDKIDWVLENGMMTAIWGYGRIKRFGKIITKYKFKLCDFGRGIPVIGNESVQTYAFGRLSIDRDFNSQKILTLFKNHTINKLVKVNNSDDPVQLDLIEGFPDLPMHLVDSEKNPNKYDTTRGKIDSAKELKDTPSNTNVSEARDKPRRDDRLFPRVSKPDREKPMQHTSDIKDSTDPNDLPWYIDNPDLSERHRRKPTYMPPPVYIVRNGEAEWGNMEYAAFDEIKAVVLDYKHTKVAIDTKNTANLYDIPDDVLLEYILQQVGTDMETWSRMRIISRSFYRLCMDPRILNRIIWRFTDASYKYLGRAFCDNIRVVYIKIHEMKENIALDLDQCTEVTLIENPRRIGAVKTARADIGVQTFSAKSITYFLPVSPQNETYTMKGVADKLVIASGQDDCTVQIRGQSWSAHVLAITTAKTIMILQGLYRLQSMENAPDVIQLKYANMSIDKTLKCGSLIIDQASVILRSHIIIETLVLFGKWTVSFPVSNLQHVIKQLVIIAPPQNIRDLEVLLPYVTTIFVAQDIIGTISTTLTSWGRQYTVCEGIKPWDPLGSSDPLAIRSRMPRPYKTNGAIIDMDIQQQVLPKFTKNMDFKPVKPVKLEILEKANKLAVEANRAFEKAEQLTKEDTLWMGPDQALWTSDELKASQGYYNSSK
jgi:hypothetical protein